MELVGDACEGRRKSGRGRELEIAAAARLREHLQAGIRLVLAAGVLDPAPSSPTTAPISAMMMTTSALMVVSTMTMPTAASTTTAAMSATAMPTTAMSAAMTTAKRGTVVPANARVA